VSTPTSDDLEGVRTWTNPVNRFFVYRLHYTADPKKRDPAWRREAKAGMPDRGWAREYEISFETPEGEPVFPEFTPSTMVRPTPVLPDARLLRGWDFGHVCPAVVFAQLDAFGRLRVVRELLLPHSTVLQLAHAVRVTSTELMGRPVNGFDAGDPAGEAFTDLGQVRATLAEQGFTLQTHRAHKESYEALRARLLQDVFVPGEGKSPALLIDPSCPELIRAMTGGFHLSSKPPYKPVEVHPSKDIVDALRYLHTNLLGIQSDHLSAMAKAARIDWAWGQEQGVPL
jgi:hypothetical protein